MIWKDRIKQYPHRYTLTNVSGSTYDFAEVTGDVNEAGTPVNAENLNKLIQRDGDDIKDTVTTFTEASTRANIATGESTATLFGKIKKWLTDLKPHAFNDLDSVPISGSVKPITSGGVYNSTYRKVYKGIGNLTGITTASTVGEIVTAMGAFSVLIADIYMPSYPNLITGLGTTKFGTLQITVDNTVNAALTLSTKPINSTTTEYYTSQYRKTDASNNWSGWKQIVNNDNISTVMPISSAAASNDKVLSEKVVYDEFATKSYADSVSAYDKIIRNQTEFNALIASPNWLGATSVALVGQFTLSTANNSGIKIPQTVKQIHGFNGAKITITNFAFNLSTAKGGLWYYTLPTTNDYGIRDLEVDCAGAGLGIENGIGFNNCTNLTNCIGTGTGTGTEAAGDGFSFCTNLANCTGTGTGAIYGRGFYNCTNLTNCAGTATGTGAYGFGFRNCTNLANCTGTGTETNGYGFNSCTNLTNCTGTGTEAATGAEGYGFYDITYASNCRDGGSSTAMWGGENKNIDIDTCRKIPATANNTTLNT